MTELNDAEAMEILRSGELPGRLREAAERVALVLSQSWCPQWLAMKLWLGRLAGEEHGLKVYFLEYDRKPYFQEFMEHKETVFQNDLVPYLRYYREGRFLGDSNFCFKEGFLDQFGN